ncbi:MAG: toll/interleukin-1 receptor domain-containing protein [Rhodocyclaceae bacterium]|nr:toll/interleukin-1 receptor domain-containing protein [Rhodocyclaceae bacterium]
MADVFISYKRTERDRVARLAELLAEAGLDVWFDARLEAGRGEGFDAEIEREVTSAHCVLVCWTPEAVRSIYVKAESKKGLEREVLQPVFLNPCTLPVQFNAIDCLDLAGWQGDAADPRWRVLLSSVQATVSRSKATEAQRIAHSEAAYGRIEDRIYPGTLKSLVERIAALHDADARHYDADIQALLDWLESVAEKEARLNVLGLERAGRQAGGDAWRWWDDGNAARRSARLTDLRAQLRRLDEALAASQRVLDQPAP